MERNRLGFILAVALACCSTAPAQARIVGGSAGAGCYATFDGITATQGPNKVVVAPDSATNACKFDISVCAFQTDVSGCTPKSVVKFRGNGTRLLDLTGLTNAAAPTCAPVRSITLQLAGRKKSKKKIIQLTASASSGPNKSDKNKITLICKKGGTVVTTGCPDNPAGGPRQLDYTIANSGTDLDTGFSGVSHNFPVIAGSKLSLCLTECDKTTNPVCKASGPTGKGSLNTETFGAPLPLFAAGVPVCVVNRFRDTAVQATVNVQTGEYQSMVSGTATPIVLLSDIYNTSANQVCPKCSGNGVGATGKCDSGPNENQNCTTNGTVQVVNPQAGINEKYNLSNDCPPGGQQGSKTGTVTVILPVTTGTDSRTGRCPGQPKDDQCGTFSAACTVDCTGTTDVKGGMNQWCCSDSGHTPCFPTASNSGEPNHAITRTGSPVVPQPPWPDPTYPKTGTDAKTVATFCIASSGGATIDQVAGLPGPGAVTFNGTHEWLPNAQ
jgi:hypothetical protein